MDREEKDYIGIDIGGTKTSIVIGTPKAEIQAKKNFLTRVEKGPDFAINNIWESIYKICQDTSHCLEEIKKIGVSCGGPLDSKKGIILSPPNLPGWDKFPIKDILEKEFEIPVNLQNDANAGALAEWRFGAGRGYNNLIFLTMGTGMGAGLILGGKLYSGANDLAGEVGHIRLAEDGPMGHNKRGSFEGFCSGGGIAQLAKSHFSTPMSAEEVGQTALAGDKVAIDIIQEAGRYLGHGLSILIDILNPEIIVIGTIAVKLGELILSPAKEIVQREALSDAVKSCKIVPAQLGEQIGDIAALCTAMA